MAFTPASFLPVSAMANSSAPRQYVYKTSDAIATVVTDDYFLSRYQNLQAGDIIHVLIGVAELHKLFVITSTSATVVVQLSTSQELTETATLRPGVQSVEVNHGSTPVLVAVADAKEHQGLFAIVNTSGSGTEAHVVTLTSGSFNGTNNIATLNAPLEALFVWFDSAGAGTVVENVGSVALSGP